MLIDNQVGRFNSPATDLAYFLYVSIKGHVRRGKLNDFLEDYYSTFSSVIQAGGATVPFTLSELREEFRKKMKFAFMFCLLIVPLLLVRGDDLPTAEEFMNNLESKTDVSGQKWKESIHDNPTLEEYFIASVDDMVESGVFS